MNEVFQVKKFDHKYKIYNMATKQTNGTWYTTQDAAQKVCDKKNAELTPFEKEHYLLKLSIR